MGFCRLCGDIVAGVRCRCGGTAVAPVFAWNHEKKESGNQDSLSKAYVSTKKSTSQAPPTSGSSTILTARRFPRPKSTTSMSSSSVSLSRGVSEHILATTQSPRPSSPLKFATTFSDPASDILPSLSSNGPTLSKVYGSVLQPKETLPLHSCAICSVIFPPDSTIYPNSSDTSDGKSFLCRQCFTANGGSKGNCPSCSRPVLALKAEGGFVQSGGKYWHKGCFTCGGCFKNIGNTPMVDLLGRPTCADCFDNCLKRDHPATPKKNRLSANNSPSVGTGLSSSYGRKSREGSPMIEELQHRLGIVRSRENSPAVADSGRYMTGSPNRSVSAQVESPKTRRYSNLGSSNSYSNSHKSPSSSRRNSPLHRPISQTVLQQLEHKSAAENTRTPDRSNSQEGNLSTNANASVLDLSDLSTALFKDSGPKTSRTSNVQSTPLTMSDSSTKMASICNKCQQPILNPRQGGQFVTIPGVDENDTPKLFHNDCFRCGFCDKPVNDSKKGQASFTLSSIGPCHVHCTPAEQHTARHPPIVMPLEISARGILDAPITVSPIKNAATSSSKFERPLSTIQPKTAMPRFGGQSACPGCQKAVSPMERGVVPGPQGTRWHASCLVCGGKKAMTAAKLLGREDKLKGQPGCGKKLDSAAKSDGEGGIWCRECLLLIGIGGSPQTSPTRTPFMPPPVDTSKIAPQFTGPTTTIARQFTGMGGDTILKQLTGALSPTRSISPTKQLGMTKPGMRPRPKSVIGMRNVGRAEEGRGMFLIRQRTGQAG